MRFQCVWTCLNICMRRLRDTRLSLSVRRANTRLSPWLTLTSLRRQLKASNNHNSRRIMRTTFNHSYQQFANQKDCSEYLHIQQINHFNTKLSSAVFRKTPEERQLLKTRMYAFPNKRHTPVGFNK